MQPRVQRRCSLPNFSQTKGRSPQSVPVINVTDENDITVLSNADDELDSRKSMNRKQWYRRILSLKDDIETAYARLGSQIKSGICNMKTHLSPSLERAKNTPRKGSSRCLIVHHQTEDKKRKKTKCSPVEGDDEFSDYGYSDYVDKNYSPSLVMHPLKEGTFSAHISLNSFPSDDNIVVKVRGYKLDIFQQKRRFDVKDGSREKTKSAQKSYKCGEIDLPIYVEPSTLQFSVNDDCDLFIQGHMKGSMGQRLSLSADDLIIKGIRNNYLSQKKNKSIWYLRKSKEAEDGSPFRERAYTSMF